MNKAEAKMLEIFIKAATRAIRDIGGVTEFRKLPMFGSNDR